MAPQRRRERRKKERSTGISKEASGREEGFGSKETRLNGNRRLTGEMERKITEKEKKKNVLLATNSEHQILTCKMPNKLKNYSGW